MPGNDCQTLPCTICCQRSKVSDPMSRLADCSAARRSGKGPCSVCDKLDTAGNELSGSILVDAVAAVIFFFFWMMQFWLNMASCIYRGIIYICHADRSVQIVAGGVSAFVIGSLIIHGLMGGRCCHSVSTNAIPGPDGDNVVSAVKVKQGDDNSRKNGGGFFSFGAPAIDAAAKVTADIKAQGKVLQSKIQVPSPQAELKIKFKDKKLANTLGLMEKTFYLTITDEKKKKLFETSAKFQLPASGAKLPLVITIDPIILEVY